MLSREKGEFGEVRQLEFVEKSTKEEEVKQQRQENTKYLHKGPLESYTCKTGDSTGPSVFMRLESSFRFQLSRVKTFSNETPERPCQEVRLN